MSSEFESHLTPPVGRCSPTTAISSTYEERARRLAIRNSIRASLPHNETAVEQPIRRNAGRPGPAP
jgi:hypothetical protein